MKRSAITLLATLLCSGVVHAQPQPTLSLDFEDGANGIGRDGKSINATIDGKAEFVEGKFGKAFKSGPGAGYLRFPVKDIVRPEEGTVEMWVSPLDWDGTEQKFHVFFDARGLGAIYLYKYYQGGLMMLSAPDPSGPFSVASAEIKAWKPGEWHHIAGTWSATHQAVYIDGMLMNTTSPGLPRRLDGQFTLGDHPWTEPLDPRTTSSLIDRVRIYDRVLSAEHIAAHFAGDYDRIVPLSSKNLGLTFTLDRAARSVAARVSSIGADTDINTTRIEFSISQNGVPIQTQESLSFTDSVADARFSVADFKPGEYQINAVARNGETELARLSKPFTIIETGWMNNRIAEELKVLPPWTPLQVKKTTGGDFSVECWGRSYRFGKSALPVQIVSKSELLLASPVALKVLAGGKTLQWTNGQAQIKSASPVAVEIIGRAQAKSQQGNVVLNTKLRLEYDGLIMLNISMEAPDNFKAESISLDIPMRSKTAFYRHRWLPQWAGKSGNLPAGNGVVDSTDFIPYAWLGDNDRGLFWFCETAQQWPNFQSKNAFETVRGNNAVTMRLNLLKGQVIPVDWNFECGLQATPVKPMPRDWRKRRLLPAPRGNVSIMWPTPTKDSQKYYGYPEATEPAAFAARIKDLHAKGISAVPYSALSFFSGAAPEWPWFEREWSQGTGDATSSDVALYGAAFEMVVPTSEIFSDFIIWKNQQFMQQFNLDGYYHDNTHPYACLTGQAGCGWQDAAGKTHPTYPIMAYRDLYRRLYSLVKTAKPNAFLMAHMSGKVTIPILAYEDSYLDGEHFRGKVKDSYMDMMTLDEFRAEYMGRQWGIMPYFLPEFDAEHTKLIEPTRGLAALLMIHDVSPWPIWSNIDVWTEMYDALDAFGYVDADFIPYFDPTPPARTDMKDVYISVYKRRDGRALAIVGNLSKEDKSGTVTLNAKRIGIATDKVLAWPDKSAVSRNGDKIKLDVPRLGYRMLLIGKAP